MHKLFLSLLHTACHPTSPVFSFGLFAIPDMSFHTRFPVAEMRKHGTCIMWDLGIGKRYSHLLLPIPLPIPGAYCLAMLPILSINPQ
jgi:hypothetical protein